MYVCRLLGFMNEDTSGTGRSNEDRLLMPRPRGWPVAVNHFFPRGSEVDIKCIRVSSSL